MSLPIARIGAPAPLGLGARIVRALAIAALTVGLQVPVTVAAADGSADSIKLAVHAPIAAIAAVDGAGSAEVVFQSDDGEDHFDEGDDEFDCDDVDGGEDPCEDHLGDGSDAGDDEYEAGCANYDDGEDRCLDEGKHGLDLPLPAGASTDDAAAASSNPAGLAALAALVTMGAGSLWFLRRGRR
jgi:hypothetical protein